MTSVSPCGPGLKIGVWPCLVAMDSPVAVSTSSGVVRKYSDAYFISVGRIFLPMYSGVRPTISPATNTVTMARINRPYMPAPIPPGTISPSAMSSSAMPPPNAVSESWKQFTAPVEVTVVDAANSEHPGVPNLEEADPSDRGRPEDHHHGDQDVPLPVAADHLAERARQAERNQQDQEDLEDVRERVGVLERMGRVGVEEAAAVVAHLLDDLLRGHRAADDGLVPAGQRADRVIVGEVLDHPAGHQDQRADHRQRQQ